MKMKGLIVGAVVAILCIGLVPDAGAHGSAYRRGYRPAYRPPRVWVAPPPPIVVVGPNYGYHHRHHRHYAHPGNHYGHYKKAYPYKRQPRHW